LTLNRIAAALLAGLWTAGAEAAVSCSLSATSVNGVYVRTANLNLSGTLTITCTRTAGEASQVIYIGVNEGEPPAGRVLTRQNGTETLAYQVYRNPAYTGQWTEAQGRAPGNANAGGLEFTMTLTGATTSSTVNYYLQVPAGTAKPAGIYDDLAITATLRPSRTGTPFGTAVFGATASIVDECFFNSSPTPLALNYTSFSATPVTGNSTFSVSCTQSTPYTMALDSTSATMPGLNIQYSLALSSASSTGTGFAQSHSVTVTIPAGQQGTCAMASCSGTATRTVTLTY